MTKWHGIRRIVAASVAGVVAHLAHQHGFPLAGAVFLGVVAAIAVGMLIIPLVWKPPRDAPRDR